MRKKIIGFLIIPILLIAVVGCDLNTLSGLMGKMGGNVLTGAGIVTVDDTQTKKVSENISKVVGADGEVDKAKLKEVKNDLKDILDSPKKAEDLKEKLNTKIKEENKGVATETKQKLEDKLDELFGENGDNDFELDIEIETEADLLVAVLFIDLLENIDDVIGDKDFDDEDLDVSDQDLLDLVEDAFLIIEVVNSVSSTGDIDVDDILADFLASFGDFRGIARSNSRDSGDDFDPEEVVVPILKSIIVAMDTDGDKKISKGELNAMISNYSLIRNSYESMAKALGARKNIKKKPVKVSDPINYLISIVMTTGKSEFEGYKKAGNDGFRELLNDVYEFINAYENNKDVELEDYISDEDDDDLELKLFNEIFGEEEPEGKVALRIRKTLETLIDASDLSGLDLFDL